VNKKIPFYYITILWVVAVFSILFILRRPALSGNNKKDNDRITNLAGSSESGKPADNSKVAEGIQKNKIGDVKDTGDLIFYDKTAFIRHFSDKYSEQELALLYSNAVRSTPNAKEKTLIRVVRKKNNESSKNSFSGDFDIRPLPAKAN
jgi:hypothetical protein